MIHQDKIIKLTKNNWDATTEKAIQVLKRGGLIIFPTETTYGAGVDATSPTAVAKLLNYKSRREGKPLSIAVADQNLASKYVQINDQAQRLYNRFLPGPVTIISQGKHQVATGVESEFGTLGIRIPDLPFTLQLLKKYHHPITATSANASGKKRPYKIQDLLSHLSQKQINLIDLIIDAGTLPPNQPSTVIDTTLSTPVAMRQGKMKINASTSNKDISLISNSTQETQQIAQKIMLKNWEKIKKTGFVIGLDGSLGTGKTIFAQGIAQFLQIKENVTSPTYSYINEYDFNRHQISGQFFHLDLWKIDNKQQFDLLQINKLIKPGNVIAIEWWQHISNFASEKNINADTIITLTQQQTQRTLQITNLYNDYQ